MGASAHLQVFVLIQGLDVASTMLGLRMGVSEANLVVNDLLGIGWWSFVLLKIVLFALVITFLITQGGMLWARTVHGVNTVYAGVVGWNLGLLLGGWSFTIAFFSAALVATLPWIAQIVMELTRRRVARQIERAQ